MKKFVLLAFQFLFIMSCYSQNYTIRGRILDTKKKEPLFGANILMMRQSDMKKFGGFTDKNGFFNIKDLQPNRYIFKVTFVGYKPFERNIQIKGSDQYMGDILLQADSIVLNEVTSFGNIPIAEQKGDTVQFIASSYKVNKDANVDELVQKMPGITVDNGTVKAQGENVKQVLVDGRQFFGEDPMAALKNLPAEIVDKVQVFDKLSEQAQFTGFDDGQTTKTMNIVTRQRMRNGQFGKFNAGYGYDTKYQSSGVMNLFNNMQRISIVAQSNNINNQNFSIEDLLGAMGGGGGRGMGGGRMGGQGMRTMRQGNVGREMGGRGGGGGRGGDFSDFLVNQQDGISTVHAFGINYSDVWNENMQVSGVYFFNASNNDADRNLNRSYIQNVNQTYQELSVSESKNINHRLNLRFEYNIDSLSRLLIQPRLSFQSNNGDAITNAETFSSNLISNNSKNNYSSELKAYNFRNEIVFNKRFLSGRSISIGLNTSYNPSTGASNSDAENYYFGIVTVNDTLLQNSDLERSGYNIGSNVMFTQPIDQNNFIQVNYNISLNKNESDKKYFNVANQLKILDSLMTNIFDNNYWTHRSGLAYGYQTKDIRLSIGVAYNLSKYANSQTFPTAYTKDRNYTNILPTIRLRYNINVRQNLQFAYSLDPTIPSIDLLQNVLDNSNQLQLSIGNPNLKQDLSHNLNFRYSSVGSDLSSNFFVMFNTKISGEYIGKNTIFAAKDTTVLDNILLYKGTQITYPVNLNDYYGINCFSSYGTSIEYIKSNLNFNTSLGYFRTPNSVNSIVGFTYSKNIGFGISFNSNMSEDIDFTLSTNYTYSDVSYSDNSLGNSNYYNYYIRFRMNYIFLDNFIFQTNINYQYFNSISSSNNPRNFLTSISLGKKFLANNQAELKLSVYDLFNTNSSIQKNSTEFYIEDVKTNVMNRYFLLNFTYNFRAFGSGENEPRF